MTKLSSKAFRQYLLMSVMAGLGNIAIMLFLLARLEAGVFQILLWAEVGFYLVYVAHSSYQLLSPKAFKRGLIARNDERYQLIDDKAKLAVYVVVAFFLGVCFSIDALGYVLGTQTISLAIWEFILILISLVALSYGLAKLYYQHRL